MASLKSFLYGAAPILDMTGAALYERQRALLALGALEANPGRGPGSGVPLTAENVAAVVISVLAAETLSEINESVAELCNAPPSATHMSKRALRSYSGPTFKTEVARALAGNPLISSGEKHFAYSIVVSRQWRGRIQILPDEYIDFAGRGPFLPAAVTINAEIEYDTLTRLIDFTRGALSQASAEDEE